MRIGHWMECSVNVHHVRLVVNVVKSSIRNDFLSLFYSYWEDWWTYQGFFLISIFPCYFVSICLVQSWTFTFTCEYFLCIYFYLESRDRDFSSRITSQMSIMIPRLGHAKARILELHRCPKWHLGALAASKEAGIRCGAKTWTQPFWSWMWVFQAEA